MEKIKQDVLEKVVTKFPDTFKTPKGKALPVVFSLDNASIHDHAAITAAHSGMTFERIVLPPHCCDMQKVIEHTFGNLSGEFKKKLLKCPGKTLIATYKTMCHQAFHKVCTAESVKADADTLDDTLEAIIAAGGNWPCKALR